jgi:hypothetical protein
MSEYVLLRHIDGTKAAGTINFRSNIGISVQTIDSPDMPTYIFVPWRCVHSVGTFPDREKLLKFWELSK